MGPLLRWYYDLKYRAFRRESRTRDGRRGIVALQIDALSYADLRRAMALGYCPTISRLLSSGKADEAMDTQNRGIELALFLTLPATAAFIVAAEPIIRGLFQHGHFTAVDSARS